MKNLYVISGMAATKMLQALSNDTAWEFLFWATFAAWTYVVAFKYEGKK